MEEDDEETTTTTCSISNTSSTRTLTQQSISQTSLIRECSTATTTTTNASATCHIEQTPQCQIVTHQASGDSVESEESTSTRVSPRYSLLSKSPHSSSSQEDYELDPMLKTTTTKKFLTAGIRTETAKSMESLRTTKTYLSTSERDMRKVLSDNMDMKSMECLEREIRLKRHAVSGEGSLLMCSTGSSDDAISAERRRGLWSGKARAPQHLSLPPPAGYLSLSPGGDRKLTILSPHSPLRAPELMHLSQTTLKTRRKKAMVLPRLVLPRSDSDISEVFSEHGLE